MQKISRLAVHLRCISSHLKEPITLVPNDYCQWFCRKLWCITVTRGFLDLLTKVSNIKARYISHIMLCVHLSSYQAESRRSNDTNLMKWIAWLPEGYEVCDNASNGQKLRKHFRSIVNRKHGNTKKTIEFVSYITRYFGTCFCTCFRTCKSTLLPEMFSNFLKNPTIFQR